MVCHMGWYTFGLLAHLLIDVRKVLLSHDNRYSKLKRHLSHRKTSGKCWRTMW